MRPATTPGIVTIPVLRAHLTELDAVVSAEDVFEWISLPTPGGDWRCELGADGAFFQNHRLRQSVIISACVEEDGRRWIHLSIASPDRLPSYEDLCWLKRTFLGEEGKAILVFAPASVHVNLHSKCLHLWSCMEETDPLPEFSGFPKAAGGKRSI